MLKGFIFDLDGVLTDTAISSGRLARTGAAPRHSLASCSRYGVARPLADGLAESDPALWSSRK